MSDDRLEEYEDRRNLDASPEPDASDAAHGNEASPLFVIQQHEASNMHWDLRLEVEGTLKSWAIPKGPSTDPSQKRLAIPTEDHPLDHADFEGVIPDDEYGGGTVIVWDRGFYRNLTRQDDEHISVSQAIEDGQLEFWLDGEKISGGYALTRFRDDEDHWLLTKMDDDEADARRNPTSTEPESVLSGRTLEEVSAEESGNKD